MFNQFCSVIERHYRVSKILKHLTDAVPLSLESRTMEKVYEGLDLDVLLDGFKMLRPVLALDSKRECFVIADLVPDQKGLYGARTVLHCQSIDMSHEDLPDEVKAHAPTLPRDAVVVTITKVFAVGKTPFGRVNFSGDVGLTFTASKRDGMICDPNAMAKLEHMRLAQAKPEDRWHLFNFGREEIVKAAVRALELAIYAGKNECCKLHLAARARPKKTKREIPLWEERAELRA